MTLVLLMHAPVSLGALLATVFPPLWDKTISVRQAYPGLVVVIPCGMDRGVVPLAPVAPSTHHHGSMYDCLLPQLMTLRSGSVVLMVLEMKILQYSL